ncbi:MAG: acetyltransferase [Candidatus Omnitrophica bacterium]|nr:acetyltransferase [Candidatus Omnitrophota bacterium]
MKRQDIIFWGGTGQAKVLREFMERLGYRLVAVFDNCPNLTSPFPDVPFEVGEEGFLRWQAAGVSPQTVCLVAIGGAHGRDRCAIQRFLEAHNVPPVIAIHPSAYVAVDASIGKGSQVLAHATVGAQARLGEACIVNTASSVDHECVLGDGVHICPGATLAGCVEVGQYSMIGSGAVVLPRVRIGRDAIIGAGAVVTRDIPDNKVAYGNPARIIRDNIESK